jgi:hypothetical protein
MGTGNKRCIQEEHALLIHQLHLSRILSLRCLLLRRWHGVPLRPAVTSGRHSVKLPPHVEGPCDCCLCWKPEAFVDPPVVAL